MAQATLMYGIGATKAGTSWLYRYLDAHPDCAMPDPKELHFFDTLESGRSKRQVAAIDARIATLREKRAQFRGAYGDRLAAKIAALTEWRDVLASGDADTGRYLGYLYGDAEGAKLVGDITPAYALLPEARLREMATLAPVTRFVYLLRDPVARLWSNIRMVAKRQAKAAGDVAQIAAGLLRKVLAGEERNAMARSDYAGAMARLDRAVPAASLFVGFYETLFSDASIEKLCRFLGIAPRPGDYGDRVHGGVPVTLEDEARGALSRLLAPQYAAMEARFGTLPDAWQQNMMKV